MTNPDNNILIVIPARGGSKRLPRKNILPLADKPLICWTIEAALNADLNALIVVSSDDEKILEVASHYASQGVIAHKRPSALATDHAKTVDVVRDVLCSAIEIRGGIDTVVLLQPTTPGRTSADITGALKLYHQGNGDSVVTVCEVDHPTAWVGRLAEGSLLTGISFHDKRSQDYTPEYRLNGAVYVASASTILECNSFYTDKVFAFIMPKSRSIDIDDINNFKMCEALLVEPDKG